VLRASEETDFRMEGETHFHPHVWWRAPSDGDLYGCDLCAVLYDDARTWFAYLGEIDVAARGNSKTDGDACGVCRSRVERPVLVFVRQPEQLVERSCDGLPTWLSVEGLKIVYKCEGGGGQSISGRPSATTDVAF
jgi:hypothetical protein